MKYKVMLDVTGVKAFGNLISSPVARGEISDRPGKGREINARENGKRVPEGAPIKRDARTDQTPRDSGRRIRPRKRNVDRFRTRANGEADDSGDAHVLEAQS